MSDQRDLPALKTARALAAEYGLEILLTDDVYRLMAEGSLPPPAEPDGFDSAIAEALARIAKPWSSLAADGIRQIVITDRSLTTKALPLLLKAESESPEMLTLPPIPRNTSSRKPASPPPSRSSAQEFIDSRDWPQEEIQRDLDRLKYGHLDWEETPPFIRRWWTSLERTNRTKLHKVHHLAQQLVQKRSSITNFFTSQVFAGQIEFSVDEIVGLDSITEGFHEEEDEERLYVRCSSCRAVIPQDRPRCPHCGEALPSIMDDQESTKSGSEPDADFADQDTVDAVREASRRLASEFPDDETPLTAETFLRQYDTWIATLHEVENSMEAVAKRLRTSDRTSQSADGNLDEEHMLLMAKQILASLGRVKLSIDEIKKAIDVGKT
jgi:predicted RNA-binding Zn-ribbon protein involved in translation (DUF1610 family)